MRCFSNARTPIQAIGVLREMKQRQGEQARLYANMYEVIHYRANQLTADEQTQNGELMFYVGKLLNHLRKKLLKKMHTNYRPHNLQEAFDLTLKFEKEYQITQPQSEFNIMETCYEEPKFGDVFTVEEVQIKSQEQKQGQYQQGNQPLYIPKATVPETAELWTKILSRESIQDWLQPGLQMPVSERTQPISMKQISIPKGISSSRTQPRSGCTSTQDRFWYGTSYKFWTGTVY